MVFARRQHHITKRIGSMVLLTSVAVTAITVGLRYVGLLEKTELEAYDRFMRLKPREAIDERVLVVGVEESDIQTLQEYPLHDGTLAQALEVLDSYNPRAIGLDIARDVPQGPPEGRVALTEVLSSSDRIVSACLLSSATQPGVPPAPGTAPDLVGFADFPEDIGGVIRRSIMISVPSPPPVVVGQPHLCNDDSPDNEVLSLSFLLGLIYLEAEGIFPDQTEWGALTIGNVVFDPLSERSGGYASTGAFDYQVMLNYRSPVNAVRQVSLVDVLEEQVDPSWIEDRVVLIGYTSQLANDMFITPYAETQPGMRGMPGVVVHAQAVSQILSAVLDQRPLIGSFSEVLESLWIWTWALLGGAIAIASKRLPLFILVLGICVGAGWGLSLLFFLQGLWLPVVPTLLALVVTAVSVNLLQQASRSGYAQAIYEQLRDQWQGRSSETQASNDYLFQLVRRAKAIRESSPNGFVEPSFEHTPSSESESASTSVASARGTRPLARPLPLSSPPTTLQFDSPDAQAMYDQLKAQAIQDLEQEQAAQEEEQARQRADAQRRHLDHLLSKAKSARTLPPPDR